MPPGSFLSVERMFFANHRLNSQSPYTFMVAMIPSLGNALVIRFEVRMNLMFQQTRHLPAQIGWRFFRYSTCAFQHAFSSSKLEKYLRFHTPR